MLSCDQYNPQQRCEWAIYDEFLVIRKYNWKLTSQVGHSCQVLDNSTTWHNIPEANAMLVSVAVFYRFYRCRDPSFLSLANITICSCSPVATCSEPNPAILICKQNTFCWFEQALGYAYNQNFFVYKRG